MLFYCFVLFILMLYPRELPLYKKLVAPSVALFSCMKSQRVTVFGFDLGFRVGEQPFLVLVVIENVWNMLHVEIEYMRQRKSMWHNPSSVLVDEK